MMRKIFSSLCLLVLFFCGFTVVAAEKQNVLVDQELTQVDSSLHYQLESGEGPYKIGQEGKVTLEPIYGIIPDGMFNTFKNENLEFREDGTFKALSAGEVAIPVTYKISKQGYRELGDAYLKETKNTALSYSDLSFVATDLAWSFVITVLDEKVEVIDLTFEYLSSTDKVVIGQKGQLTVKSLYGVIPKGAFVSYTDEWLQLQDNGTFVGLKPGQTMLRPKFKISEQSETELKQAYIKQNPDKKLTVADITFSEKQMQQEIPLEIIGHKEEKTEKKLPQTNEHQNTSFVGWTIILVSVSLYFYKKQLGW